jgi:hypothetical protein
MILVGVALFVFAIAMLWVYVARGSKAATITEAEFDDAYAALVAEGKLVDRGADRDAAWRDFHVWQLSNEKERLASEEWTED